MTEHLDPQRTYVGRDISNLSRLVYRSLVTFPAGATDPTEGSTPVPDLATDTGQSNEDATEWQFTVKDGPVWQDGKPVTCEDLKYGASRNFADHASPAARTSTRATSSTSPRTPTASPSTRVPTPARARTPSTRP